MSVARAHDAPTTLATWVDGRLREAIATGELPPGTKLRAEHLAAQWGISPTPLREAFQRLSGLGWVTIEPQRGARVAEVDARDVEELYDLRLVLDVKALRSAMAHADETYRTRVRATHRGLSTRHPDLAAYMQAHRDFHLALVSTCTNRRLVEMVANLHDHTQRAQLSASIRRTRDPIGEHDALCDAVLAGDVRTATRVLTEHLRASRDAMRA